MIKLARTPSKRVCRVIFYAMLFQCFALFAFHHHTRRHVSLEDHATSLLEQVTSYIESTPESTEFGIKASKVAALVDLAILHTNHPFLNQVDLDNQLRGQFLWWNSSSITYYPWKRKEWSDLSAGTTWPFRQSSTGIVICVGDKNAKMASHLLRSLRNVLKSALPIEIVYAGDEDLSPATRRFLKTLDNSIQFINLLSIFNNSLIQFSSYDLKPFALLASSFPRTLLVDADTIILSKPDNIFSSYPSLLSTGALFFHDRFLPTYSNRQEWIRSLLVSASHSPSHYLNHSSLFWRGFSSEEADSGLIVIDKSRPRMFLALLLTCWMNTRSIREEITYKRLWGDKETFWIAAELLGRDYIFEETYASIAATEVESPTLNSSDTRTSASERVRVCSKHLLHLHSSSGEPFWANSGLYQDKNNPILGFVNWTHYYAGQPAHTVITDYDSSLSIADDSSTSSSSSFIPPFSAKYLEEETEEQVAAKNRLVKSQTLWSDENFASGPGEGKGNRGCVQPNPGQWREIPEHMREKIREMVLEARAVEEEGIWDTLTSGREGDG